MAGMGEMRGEGRGLARVSRVARVWVRVVVGMARKEEKRVVGEEEEEEGRRGGEGCAGKGGGREDGGDRGVAVDGTGVGRRTRNEEILSTFPTLHAASYPLRRPAPSSFLFLLPPLLLPPTSFLRLPNLPVPATPADPAAHPRPPLRRDVPSIRAAREQPPR